MPREFSRSERMAEQLRRELADIVQNEIKDPRLGFLSFTEVRMSRDLSHAIVYCAAFNVEQQDESIMILNNAAGFVRKEIARRIRARIVPTIKFVADESVIRGAAMDELISEARKKDEQSEKDKLSATFEQNEPDMGDSETGEDDLKQ